MSRFTSTRRPAEHGAYTADLSKRDGVVGLLSDNYNILACRNCLSVSDENPTDDGGSEEEPGKYLEPGEKAEVLSNLYGQLDQNHHHHNTIIFQAYNLSVVFFGSIGSVIVTSDLSRRATAGIAVFGSFVMFMLWFWAFMYLQGRRQIKERKESVVAEFREFDDEFNLLSSVDDAFFFKHDETAERVKPNAAKTGGASEQDGGLFDLEHQKDTFQWAYFLFLGLVFAAAAVYFLVVPPAT